MDPGPSDWWHRCSQVLRDQGSPSFVELRLVSCPGNSFADTVVLTGPDTCLRLRDTATAGRHHPSQEPAQDGTPLDTDAAHPTQDRREDGVVSLDNKTNFRDATLAEASQERNLLENSLGQPSHVPTVRL